MTVWRVQSRTVGASQTTNRDVVQVRDFESPHTASAWEREQRANGCQTVSYRMEVQ